MIGSIGEPSGHDWNGQERATPNDRLCFSRDIAAYGNMKYRMTLYRFFHNVVLDKKVGNLTFINKRKGRPCA